MPKGPKGEKRPADVIGGAVLSMKILTGEAEEELDPKGRAGGLKGGKARADKLTPEQRSEIASVAARARWKKKEGKD